MQPGSFYKPQDDLIRGHCYASYTRQRIDYKLAVLTYKVHSTITPAYLSCHIKSHESAPILHSSGVPLDKPCTRTEFLKRTF